MDHLLSKKLPSQMPQELTLPIKMSLGEKKQMIYCIQSNTTSNIKLGQSHSSGVPGVNFEELSFETEGK